MTRKHFEAIAANFAWQNQQVLTPEAERTLRNLAVDMCATFRTVNPNFNSAKFMHAAGF